MQKYRQKAERIQYLVEKKESLEQIKRLRKESLKRIEYKLTKPDEYYTETFCHEELNALHNLLSTDDSLDISIDMIEKELDEL